MEMFVLRYVNDLCIYTRLYLQVGSTGLRIDLMNQSVILIVLLTHVSETICMVICLSSRFQSIILWPWLTHLVLDYLKSHLVGEGPGAVL